MKKLSNYPKRDGYRMPGEFEKHSGTYMIWPERPDNWRNGAKPAQKVFAEVFEPPPMSVKITKGHLSSNCPLRQEADYAII